MEKKEILTQQQEQNNYKLLSVNAVSKKLGVGYSTAKQWIQNGIIESVDVTGKFMVPYCKLEKFIIQKNSSLNNLEKIGNIGAEDEDEALKIISNLKN